MLLARFSVAVSTYVSFKVTSVAPLCVLVAASGEGHCFVVSLEVVATVSVAPPYAMLGSRAAMTKIQKRLQSEFCPSLVAIFPLRGVMLLYCARCNL